MGYPKWSDIPACRGTEVESWFTPEGSIQYKDEPLLKRICAGCPVRQECFEYALNHVVEGYWAGTTPRVRQQMRKRLGITAEVIYTGWETRGA